MYVDYTGEEPNKNSEGAMIALIVTIITLIMLSLGKKYLDEGVDIIGQSRKNNSKFY